jgi:2-methylcitrate dehydratase PrpD
MAMNTTDAGARTLSGKLARHVAATRFEAVPPAEILATKRLMLDTLAVGWAGSDAPGVPTLRGALGGRGAESALWAGAARMAPLDATFFNGAAAAALDYDALHLNAVVHADIVALPAVLALAQSVHADGKSFLAALAVANDVTCRLGLATRLHSGWFYTSIHGIFGAAAGCAKVLGLGPDGIGDAFGIALSQVAGTQQPMVEKSLTKRLQSAFAARAGAFSALLARSGVSGPREAFEGKFGFYAMYEKGDPAAALAGLGERYEGAYSSMKKYPSCACNHAVIEAAIGLMNEHRLAPDDVAGATARISPYMARLVGAPYDPGTNPQVAAQFSVQYSVACAVHRRRLGIAEILPDAALDPKLGAFARRVAVEVDESNAGQLAPAEVDLVTASGRRFTRRATALPGSPEQPLSERELEAKIAECMGRGAAPLAPAQIGRLTDRVMSLEQLGDVATLFDGL